MITDSSYDKMLSPNIPERFYEQSDVDWYGRALVNTYIKQTDGTYKKARLANVKVGNIFKLVNVGDDVNAAIEYRASSDAIYSQTLNQVVIEAVKYSDYQAEINEPDYKFVTPTNKLCRS